MEKSSSNRSDEKLSVVFNPLSGSVVIVSESEKPKSIEEALAEWQATIRSKGIGGYSEKESKKAQRINEDAEVGRIKHKRDKMRTNKSTQAKRKNNKPAKEAAWREAERIAKNNKSLRGKPYAIAAVIYKRSRFRL